jgi:hypothetical protein
MKPFTVLLHDNQDGRIGEGLMVEHVMARGPKSAVKAAIQNIVNEWLRDPDEDRTAEEMAADLVQDIMPLALFPGHVKPTWL